MQPSATPPTVFISYSWENDNHKAWARALAERLRSDGIDANLDQWMTVPGDQLPAFMERALSGHAYIVVVCTPTYKTKSDARQGGVGYEGDIMTGELLAGRNRRKFIPVLRQGDAMSAIPSWLAGCYYVDLREGAKYEDQYEDLLSTLLGDRTVAPPVAPARPRRTAAPPRPTIEDNEPVRIVGVIADSVTSPRSDGTPGSALYSVPFRLSKPVSHEWAELFERVWNHPPSYTSKHRPGIAAARGTRIILNGTTIEEVQAVHRETLVLSVKETNRLFSEYQRHQRAQQVEAEHAQEEHRRRVNEAAAKIRFDD